MKFVVLYVVLIACLLGFVLSLRNYFLGSSLKLESTLIHSDLRAAATFLIAALTCIAIVYVFNRPKKL